MSEFKDEYKDLPSCIPARHDEIVPEDIPIKAEEAANKSCGNKKPPKITPKKPSPSNTQPSSSIIGNTSETTNEKNSPSGSSNSLQVGPSKRGNNSGKSENQLKNDALDDIF